MVPTIQNQDKYEHRQQPYARTTEQRRTCRKWLIEPTHRSVTSMFEVGSSTKLATSAIDVTAVVRAESCMPTSSQEIEIEILGRTTWALLDTRYSWYLKSFALSSRGLFFTNVKPNGAGTDRWRCWRMSFPEAVDSEAAGQPSKPAIRMKKFKRHRIRRRKYPVSTAGMRHTDQRRRKMMSSESHDCVITSLSCMLYSQDVTHFGLWRARWCLRTAWTNKKRGDSKKFYVRRRPCRSPKNDDSLKNTLTQLQSPSHHSIDTLLYVEISQFVLPLFLLLDCTFVRLSSQMTTTLHNIQNFLIRYYKIHIHIRHI